MPKILSMSSRNLALFLEIYFLAILNLIDKSNNRKRAKEEGQTVDTPEIGVQVISIAPLFEIGIRTYP